MKKILLTALILLFAISCYAEDKNTEGRYIHGNPMLKGKRGLVNIVTSPVEIPKNAIDAWKASKPHPVAKFVNAAGGTVKGVTLFVGRLGSGLWDVLTLNIDLPKDNQPLMKPDYLWE